MISLSSLIKSQYAKSDEEKVISLKSFQSNGINENQHENQEEEEEIVDLNKVREEAEAIVRNAEMKSLEIISQANEAKQRTLNQIEVEKESWQNEKQLLVEAAEKEGYDAGFQQGEHNALGQYKSLIEDAKNIVDLANSDYTNHIESAESTILCLAIKVAEKILHTKLEEDSAIFKNVVEKVIKEIRDHQDIQIYVNPAHYDHILAHKDELESYIVNVHTSLYIYPEEELELNGCVIESSFGRIDASVDTQLAEIKSKLLEQLEGEN